MLKKLIAIIGSEKLQFNLVKEELGEIKKKFKTDRDSKIISTIDEYELSEVDDKRPVESVVVGITKAGTIKCLGAKHFASVHKEYNDKVQMSDVYYKLISTTTDKVIIFFTNKGNAYKTYAGDIEECKWKDKGIKLGEICKEVASDEYAVSVFEMPDATNAEALEKNLIFFSSDGMIKKTAWKEYFLLKNFYQAAKFKDGDELRVVESEVVDSPCTICFVTEGGMVLNCFVDDIPLQGRISGGVKGMMLAEGDRIIMGHQVSIKDRVAMITDKGYAKKVRINEIEPMARYRKGVKIIELGKTNNGSELVFAEVVSAPYDVVIESKAGEKSAINTDNFDNQPRTSTGKSISKSRSGIEIDAVYKYNVICE